MNNSGLTRSTPHIDAPRHFLNSNTFISDFQQDDIVLLLTGFSSLYGQPDYYKNFDNHPIIDTKFAELLCRKKIKMLGMDTPKPDNYPFDIHKLLLSNNILILVARTGVRPE